MIVPYNLTEIENRESNAVVSYPGKTLQQTTVTWLSNWRSKNQSSAEYDEEDFNCNEENRSTECLQCLNLSQKPKSFGVSLEPTKWNISNFTRHVKSVHLDKNKKRNKTDGTMTRFLHSATVKPAQTKAGTSAGSSAGDGAPVDLTGDVEMPNPIQPTAPAHF